MKETHKGFKLKNYKNILNRVIKNHHGQEGARHLGCMETILIMNGVISIGQSFEYKEIPHQERKYWFFFSFGPMVTRYRTQKYWELMVELFGDFIKTVEDE